MLKQILVAALAINMGTAAVARDLSGEPRHVLVKVAAGALVTEAGKRRVMRQISEASSEVCGSYASAPQSDWPIIGECRTQAMSGAERQLAAIGASGRMAIATSVRVAAR